MGMAMVVMKAQGGEYWASPGAPGALIGVVAAALTHKEPEIGENETGEL